MMLDLECDELIHEMFRTLLAVARFYKGIVKSYDQDNNKHEIKYSDGDIEVLC